MSPTPPTPAVPDEDAPAASPPQERVITRLTPQKNDPERVSVFLDGAFAFGAHQRLAARHGLAEGRVLPLEKQQEIVREDRQMQAEDRAVQYLAHKPRTEAEVRRKLEREDYEADLIDAVVERLYAWDYLDDARYAQAYVQGRFSSKGYGPIRLRHELARRGVRRALIDRVLEEHLEQDETLAAARAHAEKKWRRLDASEDPRRRRKKLFGYLRRRGFSYDTIRRVADEVAQEE